MATGSLLNARIVERLGMRVISHSAIMSFTLIACIHLACALAGLESMVLFIALQAALMFSLVLANSNVSALAMEPLGAIAGTAASLQGFITTIAGALIGAAIGQSFNGSVVPIVLGYALVGLGSLIAVLITERGALFHPRVAVA